MSGTRTYAECPRCGVRRQVNRCRGGSDLCRDCLEVEPGWPDDIGAAEDLAGELDEDEELAAALEGVCRGILQRLARTRTCACGCLLRIAEPFCPACLLAALCAPIAPRLGGVA